MIRTIAHICIIHLSDRLDDSFFVGPTKKRTGGRIVW